MDSLQGSILVAAPALVDPNFRKAVVLVVRHSAEEGALGLVLNRQTSTTVRELWERMGEEICASEQPLSFGGPCEGPLTALHTDRALAEIEVIPGLFFSADSDHLRTLASNPACEARFFFGYAGWGPAQLEMELQQNAWRTEPAALKHVFALHQHMWEKTINEASGWEVLKALRIKSIPHDPRVN